MKTLNVPQWLLILCAFLVPLVGGQVSLDLTALAPHQLGSAIFSGPQTPLLSGAVVSLLCAVALIWAVSKRKVVQIPSPYLSGILAGFFALLAFSVLLSEFDSISLASLGQWLTYGLGFFAVVAVLGRKTGPLLFVAAMVAGCVIMAVIGIQEFADIRQVQPSWRIFARWVNPNATAGMLGVGFMLAVGLTLYFRSLWSVAAGSSAVLIGLALFLTRSKGGYVSVVVALVITAFVGAVWLAQDARRRRVVLAGASAVLVMFLSLATISGPQQPELGPQVGMTLASAPQLGGSRFGAEEQEQSFGFRKNLWEGAVQLMRENALGYGLGTYRFYSARPGITPQTHMTHQSFLQLGVEASFLAPLLLLAAGVFWTWHVFRGGPSLGWKPSVLRLTVFGAVVFMVAHSFIDSDLYIFGTGWAFFSLLGVALLLSADSVVPEFTPPAMRVVIGVGSAVIALLSLHAGYVEMLRASARHLHAIGKREEAKEMVGQAISLSPGDGENYRLQATMATTPFDAIVALRKTAEAHPNSRNLRSYGRALAFNREYDEAAKMLREALKKDPNNLSSLFLLLQTQDMAGHDDLAMETARRLIEVEETPYYQTRAIPEVVPVETFLARLFIAERINDRQEKIRLYEEALSGFERYRQVTFPKLKELSGGDPTVEYAGDSLQNAKSKLETAARAAMMLAQVYRDASRPGEVARLESLAAGFALAASEVPSPK